MQIDYIDGNKTNNNFKNLKWHLPFEIEIYNNFAKKPVLYIETNLEFESSYKAADWIIKEKNYNKKYSTVANNIRECARGIKSKAYGYTWKYI